jgi:hypothetical protein
MTGLDGESEFFAEFAAQRIGVWRVLVSFSRGTVPG